VSLWALVQSLSTVWAARHCTTSTRTKRSGRHRHGASSMSSNASGARLLVSGGPDRKPLFHGDVHCPIYTYRPTMRRSNCCRMLVGAVCGHGSRNLSDPVTWCLVLVYRCPRYERGSCAYDASSDMFALRSRRVHDGSAQFEKQRVVGHGVRRIYEHIVTQKIFRLMLRLVPLQQVSSNHWSRSRLVAESHAARRPTVKTSSDPKGILGGYTMQPSIAKHVRFHRCSCTLHYATSQTQAVGGGVILCRMCWHYPCPSFSPSLVWRSRSLLQTRTRGLATSAMYPSTSREPVKGIQAEQSIAIILKCL
jgi:hypothetical protein